MKILFKNIFNYLCYFIKSFFEKKNNFCKILYIVIIFYNQKNLIFFFFLWFFLVNKIIKDQSKILHLNLFFKILFLLKKSFI